MRLLLTILIFFLIVPLWGQGDTLSHLVEKAKIWHDQGAGILHDDHGDVFNKVVALGKFRGSQRLLDSLETSDNDLQKSNTSQIRQLITFFSANQNPDSMLRLTRFYPEAEFKADKRYTNQFKIQVIKVLDYLKKTKRDDFFKIENLNYTSQSSLSDSIDFILDFEKYWPFEVIQFEKKLQEKESSFRILPKDKKEEMLYYFYQNKLNDLQAKIKIDSLTQTLQYTRQKKDATESELKLSQQQFSQLKKISIAVIALLLLGGFYGLRKSKQLLKNMNQTVLEEKKRSEELLLNMLPAEVARELKNKAAARAHKYESVSVLFSDFQNFSQIAKTLTPEELVMELDYCFTAFDRIIDKYRLQKIKTIGDAYMCVGGLYTKGSSHVNRMVLAALEIQSFLGNLKKRREAEQQHFFEARIGIHTGPIVAGVVGTKKFAFDIWGDSVNVAQQMEYHSEPGRINITGETYELIKDKFKCTFRGKAVVKNMKAFDMYFVDGLAD